MKTFSLPASDCGCFIVGAIDRTTIGEFADHDANGEELPEFGVIVWYKSEEAAKAAFQAVQKAHWPEETATPATSTDR